MFLYCFVIAVIVILAAMLLPALSRTKEKARRVVCMNHLHNFYLALVNHADDKLFGHGLPAHVHEVIAAHRDHAHHLAVVS